MEKSFEIDVTFTDLPQAASIYMLDSPARIVMDFNNVFIEKAVEKHIDIDPVRNISVIKREGEVPYTGVVVNLQKKVAFHYEQIENRILVSIPWEDKRMSRRSKIMLIGTAGLLAGGVVTGMLLRGDEEQGDDESGKQPDLGTPPEFPDY